MSWIECRGLTFGYEGRPENVFENVEFRLDSAWRTGVVGRNGRGKTTLLRLLAGTLQGRGTLLRPPCDCFPLAVAHPERPAGEAVRGCLAERQAEGMARGASAGLPAEENLSGALADCEDWRLERELALLEAEPAVLERPFGSLSGGEQTKVLLAALFAREDRFVLLDEPTNHLDERGRACLGKYLRGKRGYLLVSHDRALLNACTDHILAINRSGIEVQKGNFSSWEENVRRREAEQRAENERLRRDISRLGEAMRRTAAWSDRAEAEKFGSGSADRGFLGHKSAKMMARAKAVERRREQAVEEKSELLVDVEENDPLTLCPLAWDRSFLLRAEGLSIGYERPLLTNVSLDLRPGERVALRGPNGCGKTTLLKVLGGEQEPLAGRVLRPSGLVLSVLPQSTVGLSGMVRDLVGGTERTLFLTLLAKLGLPREAFARDAAALSEGQKKKVLLARSLAKPAHLYLWDEPLNYIDVLSRIQVEEALARSGATVLFVDHDARFVERTATRVISLTSAGG